MIVTVLVRVLHICMKVVGGTEWGETDKEWDIDIFKDLGHMILETWQVQNLVV